MARYARQAEASNKIGRHLSRCRPIQEYNSASALKTFVHFGYFPIRFLLCSRIHEIDSSRNEDNTKTGIKSERLAPHYAADDGGGNRT